MDRPDALLEPWANFYVMIGSAAAGLTGLMFVVVTLISGTERRQTSREATAAFSTPTVVLFGAALLTAATLCAPWHNLIYARVVLGLCGIGGIFYVVRTAYRIRRMPTYKADLEDWSWHTLFPLVAYGAILFGALTLAALPHQAPFAFATAVVLMLATGIHNAWDIVTFLATEDPSEASPAKVSDRP